MHFSLIKYLLSWIMLCIDIYLAVSLRVLEISCGVASRTLSLKLIISSHALKGTESTRLKLRE